MSMSANGVKALSVEPERGGILTRAAEFCRGALRELATYRELLLVLAWRDIRSRYKHSLIGIGWAVFVPFVLMVVFGAVLAKVAEIDTEGIPLPIFIYCGLVPWQFFEQSVLRGTQSLVVNRNLVTKIYFAREVLPFAAILTAGFDFLIASTLLVGMIVWYKIPVTAMVVLLPLILLIQVVFTAGVVLLFSMTNLFYRDVGQIISVVTKAWFFVTPVAYPIRGENLLLRALNIANPMSPVINSYRDLIIRGQMPDWNSLYPAIAISLALLVAAWALFHFNEFRFAETI